MTDDEVSQPAGPPASDTVGPQPGDGPGMRSSDGSQSSPSPDKFDSADQNAGSSGGDNSVGQPTTSCSGGSPPAGDSNQSLPPCDVDELVLTEIAPSRSVWYKVVNGEFVADTPPPTRGLRCFDVETSWPKGPLLQVIGDRPGASTETQIHAVATGSAICGPSHVAVSMNPPPGQNEIQQVGSQVTFDFEAARAESADTGTALFERYFSWACPAASYLVTALSCGVRPGGTPNKMGSIRVEVYPADQYTLSCSIPALGKCSYTKESSTDSTGQTTDTTTASGKVGGDSTMTATSTTRTDADDSALRRSASDCRDEERRGPIPSVE